MPLTAGEEHKATGEQFNSVGEIAHAPAYSWQLKPVHKYTVYEGVFLLFLLQKKGESDMHYFKLEKKNIVLSKS